MWKQRYRNEALYPYNGPVIIKPRSTSGRQKLVKSPAVHETKTEMKRDE
jgi:hypothetical protein